MPEIGSLGCAVVGGRISIEIENGMGGSHGCMIMGLSKASVPLAGGTLLVGDGFLVLPHTLEGEQGVGGAGVFSLLVMVPPDVAGSEFFLQAAYLDGVAPLGISWTGGLRLSVGVSPALGWRTSESKLNRRRRP